MATFMAIQPENHIKKLVLLSPAQTFGGVKNLRKVMSGLLLKLFPSEKTVNLFFKEFSDNPAKIHPAFKEQLYLAYKYGNSNPRLLQMRKYTQEELSSIKIPVLILIGDNDVINGPRILVKAKRIIPQAETAVVPHAGHFISVDQPEIVNKMMLDFLSKPQEKAN